MYILRLVKLLERIDGISKKYELVSKLTGENFNIFQVLQLSTNEVRTHSAFIADLLNPNGSHGQGHVFLDLFIEILKKDLHEKKHFELETDNARVEIERFTGYKSKDELNGGNIDIIIENLKIGQALIIENKINAKDQPSQLIRYYNYGKSKFNTDFILLYLTLDGKEANEISTTYAKKNKISSPLQSNQDYYCISYKKHIVAWLNLCYKQSINQPIIRETIKQYLVLVKQLTGLAMNDKENNEIKDLIIKNPSYINLINDAKNAMTSIITEAKDKFFSTIKKALEKSEIKLKNNFRIKIYISEDGDGIFIGYHLTDENGDSIGTSELAKKYIQIINEMQLPQKVHSNKWLLLWYNPIKIKRGIRFENLEANEIVQIHHDNEYLEQKVNSILEEESEIRKVFLELIKSDLA